MNGRSVALGGKGGYMGFSPVSQSKKWIRYLEGFEIYEKSYPIAYKPEYGSLPIRLKN